MIKNLSSSVYFIGIGGISMSALAQILKAKGRKQKQADRKVKKRKNKSFYRSPRGKYFGLRDGGV